MSSEPTVLERNRELAMRINAEARRDPQSPSIGVKREE